MTPTLNAATREAAVEEAAARLRASGVETPEIGIVLGTGLGGLAEEIDLRAEFPYEELPDFPLSTVETHTGRLLHGSLEGREVLAMRGRFHRYEGYDLGQVTFPVRVMARLGCETLVVSNACGGMNPRWAPGELMAIEDHINLLGDNPLVGPNVDSWGPRFPDMTEAYDPDLIALAETAARERGTVLRRGVYVAVEGPNLETRAEYRMLRTLGADVVGMSTVPEVIVARHMGMRVLGIAVITDQCLPDALEEADIETIIRTAGEAEPGLTRLIRDVVARI